jgi:hypothetical protein
MQTWWDFFTNRTREDGDGRPLSLTLFNVTRGTISNFQIIAPPFWCNAVAQSQDVVYNGMICNATNTNPEFFGQKCVCPCLSVVITHRLLVPFDSVSFQTPTVSQRSSHSVFYLIQRRH